MEGLVENGHRLIAPYFWPFFKAYPYHGNINLARADARGAISQYDRFFYNRIPKAANSTITNSLASCSVARRGIELTGNPKDFFQRPASVGRATVDEIRRDYFKFVFVRNPYSRVLSAFLDKVVGHRSPRYHRWAAKKDLATPPTFASFCRYLDDSGPYADPHWAPQSDCLIIPFSEFDFVGRFEQLETDLDAVLSRLFPEKETAIRNSGPPRTYADSKIGRHYTLDEFSIISRLYACDFETFGYEKILIN